MQKGVKRGTKPLCPNSRHAHIDLAMTTTAHFSLNQVDQTCRKAAKGTGLPWGLADDIGKAVRWLVAFRLIDLATFAQYLQSYSEASYFDVIPQDLSSPLRARAGSLNPLMTGMALSDQLAALVEGDVDAIHCSTIEHPIFVAGFLGQSALTEDQTLSLSWAEVELIFYREAIIVNGTKEDLSRAMADQIVCKSCSPLSQQPSPATQPVIGSVEVETTTWQLLETLAHRTYVEATEQSRNAGAGAGLNDND